MSLPFWKILFILAVGIFSGFLNIVAAGGSLLTLPMLIFLGLPSATANGTNRIALLIQNSIAVWDFRQKGFFDLKLGLLLGVPAIIGSLGGSLLAVNLPDEIFNKILAIVMLLVLFTMIKKPQPVQVLEEKDWSSKRRLLAIIAFFFIGFYGGFMQAGIGFIIISALLVLTGMSLVKINSLKVFIIGIYTFFALIIFIINGHVDWILGFTLAAGNAIGALWGTNFAVAKGDKWIERIIIVTVSLMALKLLINF